MMGLREKGVEILTSTRVKEILPDGVRVVNTVKEILPDWTTVTKDGDEERAIGGIGKIILAMGVQSVDDLSGSIGGSVAEVHVIGDAKEPRKALRGHRRRGGGGEGDLTSSSSEAAYPRMSGPCLRRHSTIPCSMERISG